MLLVLVEHEKAEVFRCFFEFGVYAAVVDYFFIGLDERRHINY